MRQTSRPRSISAWFHPPGSAGSHDAWASAASSAGGTSSGSDPNRDLAKYGEVISSDAGRYTLRVPQAETARLTERLLADLPVIDLLVEEPPIEEVIERVFAQEIE